MYFGVFGKVGNVGSIPVDGIGFSGGLPFEKGGEVLCELVVNFLIVFLGVAAAFTHAEDGVGGFDDGLYGGGGGKLFLMIRFVDVEAHFSGVHFGFYGGGHGDVVGAYVAK